jgi:hypothetical protein
MFYLVRLIGFVLYGMRLPFNHIMYLMLAERILIERIIHLQSNTVV